MRSFDYAQFFFDLVVFTGMMILYYRTWPWRPGRRPLWVHPHCARCKLLATMIDAERQIHERDKHDDPQI